MRYTAFGLTWELPFVCPEMGDILPSDETTVDVTVSLGKVPESLSGTVEAGPFHQITPEAALFRFPAVANYLVQCGQKIIITPKKDAEESRLRLFLLGSVAALLLHQRGILPLHASGIRTPKGAVLFTGHSGFGKSTLLATFLSRGYAMLTDDLAAISLNGGSEPVVAPSFPRLKLWADSAERLNVATEHLDRIRPELKKFLVSTAALDSKPLKLHAIYALAPGNAAKLHLETVQAAGKFNVFLDYTWQKMALKRMNRHADHFHLAVSIANNVRILRAYRPERPFLPEALADLIEDDFRT